jgi:saccharopine dehydrogenase-like NADP-dependent oxidoreductase
VLRAAIRRGLAYTSIASPWLPWPEIEPMHAEAQRTGARIVLATGLEPGISSVLARVGADRVGNVTAVETAVLLSVGDAYGADSMGFILDEIAEPYTVVVDGTERTAHAFESSAVVTFPPPIGPRRAYAMPFRDQLYYPATLGVKSAIARIALDPPWLGAAIAKLTKLGGRELVKKTRGRDAMHGLTSRLRARYAEKNRFALVVEVRGSGVARATLIGRDQAQATAAGASAFVEALHRGEVATPGVWLGEQVIEPERFLARLAERGLQPSIDVVSRRPVAAIVSRGHTMM